MGDQAERYDGEIADLEEQLVDFVDLRSKWAQQEQEEIEAARADGLDSAEEASEHLAALEQRFGAELRKYRMDNTYLQRELATVQQQLASCKFEEEGIRDAWRRERAQQ